MLSSGGQSDEAPSLPQTLHFRLLDETRTAVRSAGRDFGGLLKAAATDPANELLAQTNVPAEETDRLRILLAEDNAVNQKLAITLLQKRGHTVIPTGNGKEAIAALERENFDLVLMDVQMPVMDGFQAIRSIRAKEQATGGHIPIVALTAHAMKGDREKCLAVGADDYVSKPIRTSDLLAAMDRARVSKSTFQPHNRPSSPKPAPAASAVDSAPRVFDIQDALDRVEGDRDLLEEIVRIFHGRMLEQHGRDPPGFSAGDAHLLERLAHTIRGAAANLSAFAVSAAALNLERLAADGNLVDAGERVDKLQHEIRRLLPELAVVCLKVTH